MEFEPSISAGRHHIADRDSGRMTKRVGERNRWNQGVPGGVTSDRPDKFDAIDKKPSFETSEIEGPPVVARRADDEGAVRHEIGGAINHRSATVVAKTRVEDLDCRKRRHQLHDFGCPIGAFTWFQRLIETKGDFSLDPDHRHVPCRYRRSIREYSRPEERADEQLIFFRESDLPARHA